MKVCHSFISNSSSSSFIIPLNKLTPKQVEQIHDHYNEGVRLGIYEEDTWYNEGDSWEIKETQEYIAGLTPMDNFPMDEFLEAIGVPELTARWDHGYHLYLQGGGYEWWTPEHYEEKETDENA